MVDIKPLVLPVKPEVVPVKPTVVLTKPVVIVRKEPVVPLVPPKESDEVLKKMFTILDRSTDFSPNSEYSVLRKKYEELKGQGK